MIESERSVTNGGSVMDALTYFRLPRGKQQDLYCHDAYELLASLDIDNVAMDDTLRGLVDKLVESCQAKLQWYLEFSPPRQPLGGTAIGDALSWNYVSCLCDVRREVEFNRDLDAHATEYQLRRQWAT